MKINLFVQRFYLLKTTGIARLLFLCLLMRSSLFSYYKLDIKEAKEGRRDGLLIAFANHLPPFHFGFPHGNPKSFFFFLSFGMFWIKCSD